MNKVTKLFLGAATLLPLIYMVFFISSAFSISHHNIHDIIQWHFAFMALSGCLLFFYVIHLFTTKEVEADKKALWGITIFSAAPVAMPFYWYLNIWRSPSKKPHKASANYESNHSNYTARRSIS